MLNWINLPKNCFYYGTPSSEGKSPWKILQTHLLPTQGSYLCSESSAAGALCENWIVPGICNMKVKCGGLCFSAFFWLFGLIAGKWGDRNHDMTVFSQFSSHHIPLLFQTLPWLYCLEFPLKCTVFARLQPISSYTPATPN